MSETNHALAEQFTSMEQQQEASRLGMWTFLVTEIMFFGGLFLGYTVYRHAYPHAFAMGSKHTDVLFGTLNTAILLTSSFTMALAVHGAQAGRLRATFTCLLLTITLAIGFLVVKGFEYHEDFVEHLIPGRSFSLPGTPKAELFFYFYWAMTGLHAIHVLIGIAILSIIAWLCKRGKFSAEYHNPVEITGLYWHFVDLVWIFLYPLLYLIDRHT